MNAKRCSTDSRVAGLLLFLSTEINAFVIPSQQVVQHRAPTSLDALPEVNSFLLSDGLSAATYLDGDGDAFSTLSGPLGALRTFFVVISAAIFGITAIAYLTAAFLVPRAAEQLERDTKRLRPGLWEEYEAKLEAGETMTNRPDLLQELGNVMQPIIVQEYEREAAMKFGDNKTDSETGSQTGANGSPTTPAAKDKGDVIDVTIKQPEE